MDSSREDAPSEALLADRLARLAERRRAAIRRRSSLASNSSDDEENEQRTMPSCTAAHALRELLQGRSAELGGAVAQGSIEDGGCAAVEGAAGAPAPALPTPSRHDSTLLLESDGQLDVRTGGDGSMPPTARLLIRLGDAVGQEAAAGERQQRAAELHAADTAVREAEVREQ